MSDERDSDFWRIWYDYDYNKYLVRELQIINGKYYPNGKELKESD